MKNNIFQGVLAVVLVLAALFTIAPMSAHSGPQEKFDVIMNNDWVYGGPSATLLRYGWQFWSDDQKAQIMQRLLDLGLIYPVQAEKENWIDLPYGPAISMAQ
jgi:hypothetical protein